MNTRIFFELLAREAPAVEFETPIAEARDAGAAPGVLAELEQAKTAALRVRALLARRARREVELSALFETAGDLASLRDLDAVLKAIVRRARQLLNADVAYMTLNDSSRGDTYMRVTDGSISRAFQQLRLPLGAGLGGLVAQTGAPYASSGYLTDERFRHTGPIDAGVTEEGLVGILGVPMRLGERVIGVLFAADRAETVVRAGGGGAALLARGARGGGDRQRPAAPGDPRHAGGAERRERGRAIAQRRGRARRARP